MENPLWGAPRIHGELRELGFDISGRSVSRLIARLRPASSARGQSWMTFLSNHAKGSSAYVPSVGTGESPGGISSDAFRGPSTDARQSIRIGTKDFTVQILLGELMAQLIEARTELHVTRHFNVGGTMICYGALTGGSIDLYPEYTGTALTAILEQEVIADPERAFAAVSDQHRRRFEVEWLRPFGFNNTFAITVHKDDADTVRTVSDLAAVSETLRAGFTAELSERPDGYPGLREAYGLRFREVRDLDPALMYQVIANRDVDVICAFATDGRIAAFDLKPLTDDRGFFPPCFAAPVIRGETLRRSPELRKAAGVAP